MELVNIAWIIVISLQVITVVSGGIAYIKITTNDLKHLSEKTDDINKSFKSFKEKMEKKIGKIFDRIEENSKDIVENKTIIKERT